MTEKKAVKKKTAVKKAKPVPPKHPLKINGQQWDKQAVMDVVCGALVCSSKGLGTILKAGHEGHPLPAYSTVALWLTERTEDGATPFYDQFLMAKEAQADYLAEELAELHEKAWVPAYDKDGNVIYGSNGKLVMTVNHASAALVRLESDNKKWLMVKLKPKRFSDKNTHEHVGPGGGAIQVASTVMFVDAPARQEDE